MEQEFFEPDYFLKEEEHLYYDLSEKSLISSNESSLYALPNDYHEYCIPLKAQENSFSQEMEQHSDSSERCSKISSNRKQNYSIYHNSQKHLVLTIRKLLNSAKNNIGGNPCAQLILKKFLNNKKKNSRAYLAIFLGHKAHPQQKMKAFRKSFTSVKFQQEVIEQAQQFLRKVLISELSDQYIQNSTDKRKKMAEKQYFKRYLKSFRQELEEGPIPLRMSRDKTKKYQLQLKQLQEQSQLQTVRNIVEEEEEDRVLREIKPSCKAVTETENEGCLHSKQLLQQRINMIQPVANLCPQRWTQNLY